RSLDRVALRRPQRFDSVCGSRGLVYICVQFVAIKSARDVGHRGNAGRRRRDDGCRFVSIVTAELEARQPAPRRRDRGGRIPALFRPFHAAYPSSRHRRFGRIDLAGRSMNIVLLYLLLLKATITSFSGLT